MKSFLKGMDLFKLIAEVAEAEGILLSIYEIYDALVSVFMNRHNSFRCNMNFSEL